MWTGKETQHFIHWERILNLVRLEQIRFGFVMISPGYSNIYCWYPYHKCWIVLCHSNRYGGVGRSKLLSKMVLVPIRVLLLEIFWKHFCLVDGLAEGGALNFRILLHVTFGSGCVYLRKRVHVSCKSNYPHIGLSSMLRTCNLKSCRNFFWRHTGVHSELDKTMTHSCKNLFQIIVNDNY